MADLITGPGGYQGVLANLGRRNNLDEFSRALLKFTVDSDDAASLIVRGVGQWALAEVTQRSPVGQPELWQSTKDAKYLGVYGTKAETFKFAREGYVGGRFKGNWQVTVAAPAEGEVAGVDPTGAATLAAGNTVLASAPAEAREFWITNNLPYSERLEAGWSTQAPIGMVAATMADAGAAFEQTATEVLSEKGLS